MSRIDYRRATYEIEIRSLDGGRAEIYCEWVGKPRLLSPEDLANLREGKTPTTRALRAFASGRIRSGLARTFVGSRRIDVVNLAIDHELADIDWERLCANSTAVATRVSRVRARVENRPLQLPLRVLEVDTAGAATSIARIRDDVFQYHPPEDVSEAVIVAETRRESFAAFRAKSSWPTADVVHVHDASSLNQIASAETTTSPDEFGTLGWCLRLSGWQTRLLVLAFPGEPPTARVRLLASELVARGGPAVVLASANSAGWHAFYDQIIHDAPLDLALAALPRGSTAAWFGAGREESLRPSNVGARLQQWLRYDVQENAFSAELRRFNAAWPSYDFTHERSGLIPLAKQVASLRRASVRRVERLDASESNDVPPRHLNATLFRERGRGLQELSQIPEEWRERRIALEELLARRRLGLFSRRLSSGIRAVGYAFRAERDGVRPGELLHLGLDIGPKSSITTADLPILNDVFTWEGEGEGTWVELVVTPLDFALEGYPAQALWLPKSGASERVYFAIRARSAPDLGAHRVRFGLYHANNLVQSWLLAVVAENARDPDAALKRALGTERIDEPFSFLARPEFHSASVDAAASRPGRTISVLANDLGGERHLTIKGTDVAIPVDPDGARVEAAIDGVRAALDAATAEPLLNVKGKPLGADNVRYRYRDPSAALLTTDLQRLARAGWTLYRAVIPDKKAHSALTQQLGSPNATIQAVHTELRKTIPWSLVYDRLFDPDASELGGEKLAHATCMAALPDRDGVLGATRCRESERCELHHLRIAERRARGQPVPAEHTVACPLHFWGFAHQIETPPQVVRANAPESNAPSAAQVVDNASPVALGVGFFPFDCWNGHHEQIRGIPQIALQGPRDQRDEVIRLIGSEELDVLYLFCHAEDAALRFSANSSGKATVRSEDLDFAEWRHQPLAILNGCGTAGWSAASIAPLIETFTRNKAGAVVGTEVRVHQSLGARMGQDLLVRFLDGTSIGEALLVARRKLLGELNPLGLVYTLYGFVELRLRQPPGTSHSSSVLDPVVEGGPPAASAGSEGLAQAPIQPDVPPVVDGRRPSQ